MLWDSKRIALLNDAQNLGFKLGQPTINRMPYIYDKLSKGEIFLGMRAIKSLPRDLALLDH